MVSMKDIAQRCGVSVATVSMTLIMYLNNYLKTSKNCGMAGAISVIIFLITGLLSIFVYRSLTRKDYRGCRPVRRLRRVLYLQPHRPADDEARPGGADDLLLKAGLQRGRNIDAGHAFDRGR